MRKRIQADIDLHVRENSETGICAQIYREFEDYQNKLETDFNKFKTATTEPVWNLRLEDYSVRNLNLMYGSLEYHENLSQLIKKFILNLLILL